MKRRELGERETDLLQALWKLGAGTVSAVREELTRGGVSVAYTTVQTMLNRLVRKGQVARDVSARAHVYRPLLKQPAALKVAIKKVADRFFSGSVEELATHLVSENLTPKHLDRLRAMIEAQRKEKRR
jgi:BlaI family penicillinase repressor